jgi:hypothetical protein
MFPASQLLMASWIPISAALFGRRIIPNAVSMSKIFRYGQSFVCGLEARTMHQLLWQRDFVTLTAT